MTENARKAALVAGASGGIGSAVARKLAADGAIVYLGYCSNEEAAAACEREIRAAGGNAIAVHLDVENAAEVDAVCAEVYERSGRLDILVNCAARNCEAPAAAMDDDTWRCVMNTNLDGAFHLCRAAAKYMIVGRWGRIVNLSSISAAHGGRGQVNYAVSKAGVEAMTRVLALELGRKGVTANCVAPGVIETKMTERIREAHHDALLETIAAKRFGTPAEVAEAVAFLVSDAAGYINGQVLRVDGGMLL